MQEAYRPPCSKYCLCCPVLADPPCQLDLTPPWLDLPPQLDLTPPQLDLTPPAGADPPTSWTWPPHQLDLTWPPPPHQLTDLTPPRCELTDKVKLLPSRRTTYAGGNKYNYHTRFYSNTLVTDSFSEYGESRHMDFGGAFLLTSSVCVCDCDAALWPWSFLGVICTIKIHWTHLLTMSQSLLQMIVVKKKSIHYHCWYFEWIY